MEEEVNIEELKKLTVLSIDDVCPYIGYGEKTIPLMKALFWDLKNNVCYDILKYEECTYLSDPYWPSFLATSVRLVILYLDEDAMDDFITEWKNEYYITVIIAILPKREEGLNRRKKAIANLHKLYDARMEIYLVDEEWVKDEREIYREIRQFLTGLQFSLDGRRIGFWDFGEYCRQIFEGGFIYYAESEDYQFEKAFNVQSFIQNSHLSNNVHDRIDNAAFIIFHSCNNEFELEYSDCLQDQFLLLNVSNEFKWDIKWKNEKENDDFRCCAFFSQDKFPEYLEKE